VSEEDVLDGANVDDAHPESKCVANFHEATAARWRACFLREVDQHVCCVDVIKVIFGELVPP
jgi:hypothetical protein